MRKNLRYGCQAFTMIETLIALIIAAVLVIIAVPSFISYVQTNRLVGTAQQLYFALQNARSAAVKLNTTVYVSFTTGANWCYGINSGSACTCSTPSGCSLGAVSAPNSTNTTLATSGISGGNISFENTHGATYKSTGTVTFTAYNGTLAMGVDISPMGDITLCSSTISGYSAC